MERKLTDQELVRREKMENIRKLGIDPFGTRYDRTDFALDIKKKYEDIPHDAFETMEDVACVAGRIMFIRKMGKASFFTIKDKTGKIQVYISINDIGEELYSLFKTADIGDIVGVKGKIMRSRFAVGKSGSRVHQATAVMAQLVRIGIQQHDQSVTLLHGCTQAFFQAAFVGSRDNHFIDHHFDAVHLVAVQLHAVEYLLDLAIDTDGQIAFLTNLLEQLLIMSLTIADQRSQEVCLLSLIMLQNQVEHLLFGVYQKIKPDKFHIH